VKTNHVKLLCGKASGYPLGGTRVEINGVEVQELVKVEFEHQADSIAQLRLTIYVDSLEVEGDLPEESVQVFSHRGIALAGVPTQEG
jgi:hypothetical protein